MEDQDNETKLSVQVMEANDSALEASNGSLDLSFDQSFSGTGTTAGTSPVKVAQIDQRHHHRKKEINADSYFRCRCSVCMSIFKGNNGSRSLSPSCKQKGKHSNFQSQGVIPEKSLHMEESGDDPQTLNLDGARKKHFGWLLENLIPREGVHRVTRINVIDTVAFDKGKPKVMFQNGKDGTVKLARSEDQLNFKKVMIIMNDLARMKRKGPLDNTSTFGSGATKRIELHRPSAAATPLKKKKEKGKEFPFKVSSTPGKQSKRKNDFRETLNTTVDDGLSELLGDDLNANSAIDGKDVALVRYSNPSGTRILTEREFMNFMGQRASDAGWLKVMAIQSCVRAKNGIGEIFKFSFVATMKSNGEAETVTLRPCDLPDEELMKNQPDLYIEQVAKRIVLHYQKTFGVDILKMSMTFLRDDSKFIWLAFVDDLMVKPRKGIAMDERKPTHKVPIINADDRKQLLETLNAHEKSISLDPTERNRPLENAMTAHYSEMKANIPGLDSVFTKTPPNERSDSAFSQLRPYSRQKLSEIFGESRDDGQRIRRKLFGSDQGQKLMHRSVENMRRRQSPTLDEYIEEATKKPTQWTNYYSSHRSLNPSTLSRQDSGFQLLRMTENSISGPKVLGAQPYRSSSRGRLRAVDQDELFQQNSVNQLFIAEKLHEGPGIGIALESQSRSTGGNFESDRRKAVRSYQLESSGRYRKARRGQYSSSRSIGAAGSLTTSGSRKNIHRDGGGGAHDFEAVIPASLQSNDSAQFISYRGSIDTRDEEMYERNSYVRGSGSKYYGSASKSGRSGQQQEQRFMKRLFQDLSEDTMSRVDFSKFKVTTRGTNSSINHSSLANSSMTRSTKISKSNSMKTLKSTDIDLSVYFPPSRVPDLNKFIYR